MPDAASVERAEPAASAERIGSGSKRASDPRAVWRLRLGAGLMVASYLVYPIWAVLPTLPLDAPVLATIGFGSWGGSWVIFTAGAALAGREGIVLVQGLFPGRVTNRRSGSSSGPCEGGSR